MKTTNCPGRIEDIFSSPEKGIPIADAGKLAIDVIAYPAFTIGDDAVVADVSQNWKKMGCFRSVLETIKEGNTVFRTI